MEFHPANFREGEEVTRFDDENNRMMEENKTFYQHSI
jgi:hypothetical protein